MAHRSVVGVSAHLHKAHPPQMKARGTASRSLCHFRLRRGQVCSKLLLLDHADLINGEASIRQTSSTQESTCRWKQGWVVGMADKGWWMTELGDLVLLIIIIAMGSHALPLLLWPIPPSRGLVQPVKPEQAASEWAGKHGDGP